MICWGVDGFGVLSVGSLWTCGEDATPFEACCCYTLCANWSRLARWVCIHASWVLIWIFLQIISNYVRARREKQANFIITYTYRPNGFEEGSYFSLVIFLKCWNIIPMKCWVTTPLPEKSNLALWKPHPYLKHSLNPQGFKVLRKSASPHPL